MTQVCVRDFLFWVKLDCDRTKSKILLLLNVALENPQRTGFISKTICHQESGASAALHSILIAWIISFPTAFFFRSWSWAKLAPESKVFADTKPVHCQLQTLAVITVSKCDQICRLTHPFSSAGLHSFFASRQRMIELLTHLLLCWLIFFYRPCMPRLYNKQSAALLKVWSLRNHKTNGAFCGGFLYNSRVNLSMNFKKNTFVSRR